MSDGSDPKQWIIGRNSYTEEDAYNAGYDCAVNGANTVNCDYKLFNSPEMTVAWERGKQAGEKSRNDSRPD